ncbi:MAG TPA: phosphoribosylformylglycinamidine synthase subunit PurQ [Oligoflexia bacterium]|nr:phosphoribosylformylglycinamidine synthase subunit PurQ [Oligoflexia bacterium]
MKIAVVVFPGSGGVADAVYAYRDVLKQEVFTVWHQEESIGDADVLVIPGGSAFGDYLRPGALCKASPIIGAIRKFERDDRPIIGLGNGFQILCELDILPGVLLPNLNSRFMNTDTFVTADNTKSIWTRHLEEGEILTLPISCYCGRYYADKRTLKDLEEEGHIALRFCDLEGDVDLSQPFNGSVNAIAGILNRHENVLGVITHPERAIEQFMGSVDGLPLLESVLRGEKPVEIAQEDEDFDFEPEDGDRD